MVVGRARDQHATGLAEAFEPRRDIDANAIEHPLVLRRIGVALDHQPLDCDRAFNRGDHRRKLDQEPVAGSLDDAAAFARDERGRRLAMLPYRPRRPRLVLAHEARVADRIGGEDRGELAGFGHRVPQDRAYLSMRQCATTGRFGSIWPVRRVVCNDRYCALASCTLRRLRTAAIPRAVTRTGTRLGFDSRVKARSP